MDTIVGYLLSLAVVGLISAGFATIAGLSAVRERLLGLVVAMIALSLLVPVAAWWLGGVLTFLSDEAYDRARLGTSFGLAIAFVLGHAAFAENVIRRRFGGAERRRRAADERERARTRERPRLPPDPNGEDS